MKSLDIKALNLQYIQELEALRKEARAGKISAETYYLQVGGITQAGKAMDRHIAFIRFENQFKMDISKTTSRAKMLPSPEKESIKCPGCGKKIQRWKCLDWSGENPQKFDEYAECEEFAATRKLILGESL